MRFFFCWNMCGGYFSFHDLDIDDIANDDIANDGLWYVGQNKANARSSSFKEKSQKELTIFLISYFLNNINNVI